MPEFRELTPYEKEKWLDELGRFELDEEHFLSYGDELGEAFDHALFCADHPDYGLSEWFTAAARVQALDMYYDQILIYTGEYGGNSSVDDFSLPTKEQLLEKSKELGVSKLSYFGKPERTDAERRLWDWAFENRRETNEIVEDVIKEVFGERKIKYESSESDRRVRFIYIDGDGGDDEEWEKLRQVHEKLIRRGLSPSENIVLAPL